MRTFCWLFLGLLFVSSTGCGGCSSGSSLAEMKRNAIVRDDEEEITPPPPGMFDEDEPGSPTPSPNSEADTPPPSVTPQPQTPVKPAPVKPAPMPTPQPAKVPASPQVATETPEPGPDTSAVPPAPTVVKTPDLPVIPPGPDNWPLGEAPSPTAATNDAASNVTPANVPDATGGLDPDAVAKIESPANSSATIPGTVEPAESTPALDKRLPVPSEADRDRGLKILAELYKDEWTEAKTVDKKQAFARSLYQKAGEMSADPVGHYLMLDLVRKLSLQVGDVRTALDAVDDLGKNFQIDAVSERITALEVLSRALRSNADADLFLKQCRETLIAAVKQDDFDRANKSVELGLSVARRADRQEDIQQWQAIRKVLDEARLAFAPIPAARSALEADATNAQAHTAIGKYLCFYQRDWDRGLSHLASGSDIKLKVLAQIDQSSPAGSAQQSDLGDQWYEYAQDAKPWAQQSIQLRAAYWYQASLSGLPAGLIRARVQKRIKEISDLTGDKSLVSQGALPDE